MRPSSPSATRPPSSRASHESGEQSAFSVQPSGATARPQSGATAAHSLRARDYLKTPGGAAIVQNTVLEQKHGSEYYHRRHLLELVKVLSLTTMEQSESIQQLSSRVAKLESELEKVEPLRQLLQQLDEAGSSDSVASSILSLLQHSKPPTTSRTSGLRPTTVGSIGAFSSHMSTADFLESQSKASMLQSGFDLLKLRSDGPSNSISSETETNSSDKAQLLLCVRCASYYLASENVPISCKFHPGSLRIGNDWTAKWTCCGKLSGAKGCIMCASHLTHHCLRTRAEANCRASHTNESKGDAAAASANEAL